MLRPRLRIPTLPRVGLAQLAPRRSIHRVPRLPFEVNEGVGRFLSPEAVDMAWSQYMRLTLEKLNAMTAGTNYENQDTKNILLATSREPNEAALFNYASMAHNNHFFFEKLSPTPVAMPTALKGALERSFGSIDTLRQQFVLTASAMFGPGFVWLVRTREVANGSAENFRVLSTYLAGSPYPGAHWRRQPVDMNTVGGVTPEGQQAGRAHLDRSAEALQAAGLPRAERKREIAPGGVELWPVLCLNTWEHVWLRDYGIGAEGMGGKVAYAEEWWKAVNWEAVEEAAHLKRRKVGSEPEF